MEKAVEDENLDLAVEAVPVLAGLAFRNRDGEDDVAEIVLAVRSPGADGEAQDVGRLVFLPEGPVESPDGLKSDEDDGDLRLAEAGALLQPLNQFPDLGPVEGVFALAVDYFYHCFSWDSCSCRVF